MFNVIFIMAAVATIMSTIALVIGCVGLSIIVGLKNSTHQVVWKTAEADGKDPFKMEEEVEEEFLLNPNKRIKKEEKEDDFADLTDPSITSAF